MVQVTEPVSDDELVVPHRTAPERSAAVEYHASTVARVPSSVAE